MRKRLICTAIGLFIGSSGAAGSPAADLDLGNDMHTLPTVITPTRLKQSLMDVPASVTVLRAETLRRYGVSSLAEALRFVPGMAVRQATGNWYHINYHGTSSRAPSRMNILVDGISVYRPAFSEVFWTHLPVAFDDVERIEVTRGPNSASYGPNSMMAVVNIITKNPKDSDQLALSAQYGEGDTYVARAAVSRVIGNTAAALSISTEGKRGYDRISHQGDGHDSTETLRLVFRSQTQLRESSTLDVQAALVNGTNQIPFKSIYDDWPDMVLRDRYVGATWTERVNASHELQARLTHSEHRLDQRWTACYPRVVYVPQLYQLYRANPRYANAIILGQMPSGGSAADDLLAAHAIAAVRALGAQAMQPLCGYANQDRDESRTDFELQDTAVVSPNLRFVAGAGARRHRIESETFLGGKTSNTLYRLFGSVEYRASPALNVNVGAYAEHDQLVGWTVAPRGALNVHLARGHTVRLVASKGLRTPDIHEQRGDISYTVRTVAPSPDGTTSPRFYQSARAPGGLRPEQEVAVELGYLFVDQRQGLTVDARIFRERLTNLISEVVDVTSFHPTNNNSVTLSGAEVQTSISLADGWHGFFNYAYLDNRKATTQIERTHYSRHSGAAGVSKDLGAGWHGSIAYFGQSGDGVGESAYGRADLTVGRRLAIGPARADLMLGLSRLDRSTVSYLIREGREPVTSGVSDRTRLFGRITVGF